MPPDQTPPAGLLEREPDRLAKAWMLELMERASLEEMEGIEVGWLARRGPSLIASLLRTAGDPVGARAAGERPLEALAGELRRLRRGAEGAALLPRDVATLQAILIGALGRAIADRRRLVAAVERLADACGSIQAALAHELAERSPAGGTRNPLTGLAGADELREWLRVMVAWERRYGTPFSALIISIEGVGRIGDAPGHRNAERALVRAAEIVAAEAAELGPVFRRGGDELCLVLFHQGPIPAQSVAQRLVELIAAGEGPDGLALTARIGIASCPEHGRDGERLLAKAERATYEARASGEGVVIASGARPAWLQGR